jgi:predicted nucleic acid-binding Zn ribbon protein
MLKATVGTTAVFNLDAFRVKGSGFYQYDG